jgi:hypothetical protein
MAAHFDAEIEALQHDFREIAVELHRDRYDRALDAAIAQRATDAHSASAPALMLQRWRAGVPPSPRLGFLLLAPPWPRR